jgi:hypothetical protein
VIVTNGENGRDLMTAIASRIEDSYAFDLIDEPIPRTYGPVQ